MIRKLHFPIIALLLCLTFSLFAQKDLRKANKQYELKAFELAAFNYNKVLKADPENGGVMASLARTFSAMNNNLEASKWYKKAQKFTTLTDEELIDYGNVLKELADYDGAKKVFETLHSIDPVTSKHFTLSCDFAKNQMKSNSEYEITPFRGNTAASDFGVVPFKDQFVYCSFRKDLNGTLQKNENIPGSQLFMVDRIQGENQNVSFLRSPLKSSYHRGPVSYSEDLTKCAIMVNKMKESYDVVFSEDEDHSILIAEVDTNGEYVNAKPYEHNETGSATAFPCLAHGGKTMYLSSNRSGGYGGYDLYVSHYYNGQWTLPENLGEAINTPGNEITPYYKNDKLIYASDYSHGLGGYDLFVSKVMSGQWTFPINLGNGINSPGDDVFPYETEDGTIYFASNRLGTDGNLDVFTAYKPDQIELITDNSNPKLMQPNGSEFMPKAILVSNKNNRDNEIESSFSSIVRRPITANETLMEEILSLPDTVKPKAVKLPDADAKSGSSNRWEGARMVSMDETMFNGTKVFFIQVAALSRSKSTPDQFRNLSKFGNIYTMNKSNIVKVRLGYFLDESEARQVLKTVKNYGYNDAFITREPLNTNEMELLLSNSKFSNTKGSDTYMVPSKFSGQSKYKVRLASYEDPIFFDINKAKDIGKIEQWTKGGWTIFILGGFEGYETAVKARNTAINRGFPDAEVVIDNGGILERLKKN